MRRLAFVVAFLGMFILVILLSAEPVEISSEKDLADLEVNKRVVLLGEVVSEKVIYGKTKEIILDNEIKVYCECTESYKNNFVRIVGKVEKYKGKTQVRALEIFVFNEKE